MISAIIAAAALHSGAVAVPLAMTFNHPAQGLDEVSATVNDHAGRFLFDSGSGVTQLTPAFAAEVGCTPWGKLTGFRARGDRLDLQRCNPVTVRGQAFGPQVIGEPGVIDLDSLIGPSAHGLSGVLAFDAFQGRVVTLSLSRGVLVMETPASAARIAATAHETPLRLVRDAQGAALTADMGVPTRLGLLWMEVDSGNAGPISVDKAAAPLLGLDPAKPGVQNLDVPLVGEARLKGAAKVGDFIFDGNLGRGFLRQWDVTLDLAHGRGWISPALSTPTAAAAPAQSSPR